MYRVIQTKGTDEPWWMFENWQKMIIHQQEVEQLEEAVELFQQLGAKLREQYVYFREKKGALAFWNEGEKEYCLYCEDDLQIYHGLFIVDANDQMYVRGGNCE